ncbi:hypothetical protein [uncultured Phenylobacterium sp.]|uniref:hypothetical protein n=1 Tax=uncultured Phenylobacterium sp. TaxID=349273 RepID=UPI0025CC00C8|nr:hypothetical protein [uncultured Phenylobacterium sp.]
MAESGVGDAGALALGLRREMTSLGLRALAAKAVHVVAAAPERMIDIYDNAAAGWLGAAVFPPRFRTSEPLPISRDFWTSFWDVANLPPQTSSGEFAQRTLTLAGQLHPLANERMAVAALAYPGAVEAVAGGARGPLDLAALTGRSPASLAYAIHQAAVTAAHADTVFHDIRPLLRQMPPPLDYINLQVLQSRIPLGLVGGYSPVWLDQVAFGGFLMGQVGHHYSALTTAVILSAISVNRPPGLELVLESIFRGWVHGRATPPLIGVPWEELWDLRVDQVREALQVVPFDSPYLAAIRRQSQ